MKTHQYLDGTSMRIEHVAIWTKDIERLRSFYQRYFGAVAGARYENPAKKFSSYFLSFAGGARLELMQMEGIDEARTPPGAQSVGYAHLAVSTGSEAEVDRLTDHLRADGHAVLDGPRRTGDGYYESTVLDPDGNRIEIAV